MWKFDELAPDYFDMLEGRVEGSHVYSSHQLVGLQLADLLEDRKHKALYIKLAKENDKQKLLATAKSIAEKKDIKNKGAYFMKIWYGNSNRKK